MKLLLAEDEKDMAAALVAVLEHSGYEVDAVRDGRAALALAHKGTYACMVFDVMMPVMDGVTALKELRAAGDTTPVLLLTAKAEVGDRRDLMRVRTTTCLSLSRWGNCSHVCAL